MQRRVVRFETLRDVLEDIERLQRDGYSRAGNWSLGQVCNHLAQAVALTENSRVPRVVQRIGIWLFLRSAPLGRIGNVLGLRLPTTRPQNVPVDDETGVERLTAAIDRVSSDEGNPTIAFHLWHCQHHLSFLVPEHKSAST